MTYYPVYLNLAEKRCVVIGGRRHALEKVEGLLQAGAQVTVIAPQINAELQVLQEAGKITVIQRDYQPGDLEGAFLVIGTTMDPDLNARLWQEANARNILINAVDDVPHCNFIAPSIVRQGDLVVAISTSGTAPALAVRLRERLTRELGPEYARFLDLVRPLRQELPRLYSKFKDRRAIWYRLVDSDILELLRRGDEAGARARIDEIVHAGKGVDEAA